jgi:hypothetical protein
MAPTSEAQKRANKKWQDNNRERWVEIRNNSVKNWRENNYERWYAGHKEHTKKCNKRRYDWRQVRFEFLSILLD